VPPKQPRLFISHSSQDPILTAQVKTALASASGTHPGFDVLVDTDCLKAGQEWPIQLHAMMAYAHAGLLLFTPAAMKRPDWIRKEAYILTWRRSLDPNFKVFYVFRDGVTRKDLTASGFEPAHLNLIQALKATDPDAIGAEVKTYNPPPLGTQTPFEQLTFYLTQNLPSAASALNKLADDLGAPPLLTWLGDDGQLGAGRIAARVLAGRFGEIKDLTSLINTLKALNLQKPALKNVMRWVAPYWVSPEAVGRLAAATDDLWTNKAGGLAAINGECVTQYTAKMFVYKALPFRFECRIAEVESGTHKTDAAHFTSEICKWLRARDLERPYDERMNYPADDEGLMQKLKTLPPFLFVPIRVPDKVTLNTLRTNFPTVVFLLWTGEALEPVTADHAVVSLEPPVDTKREKAEFGDWQNALQALGG
jgi:hypothetical protein